METSVPAHNGFWSLCQVCEYMLFLSFINPFFGKCLIFFLFVFFFLSDSCQWRIIKGKWNFPLRCCILQCTPIQRDLQYFLLPCQDAQINTGKPLSLLSEHSCFLVSDWPFRTSRTSCYDFIQLLGASRCHLWCDIFAASVLWWQMRAGGKYIRMIHADCNPFHSTLSAFSWDIYLYDDSRLQAEHFVIRLNAF